MKIGDLVLNTYKNQNTVCIVEKNYNCWVELIEPTGAKVTVHRNWLRRVENENRNAIEVSTS